MVKRAWKLALMGVAVAAAMVVMVLIVGPGKTFEALQQVGLASFLSVGVLLAVTLTLQAMAWTALNRVMGIKLGPLTALEASTVGLAGNIIAPTAHMGGEPIKVLFAGKKKNLSYEALASTTLLGKYLEMISFVLFVSFGTAISCYFLRSDFFQGPYLGWGITLLAVGTISLLLAVGMTISLILRGTPLAGLLSLFIKLHIFRNFFQRLQSRAVKVELRASGMFRRQGKAMVPSFLMYLATHIAIWIKPLAFFYLGWKAHLDIAQLSLFFIVFQVLLAFQIVPSAAGTLDGGMFGMIAISGMPISAPQMAVFLLCIRFWDLVVVAIGAALASRVGAALLSERRGGGRDEDRDRDENAESDGMAKEK